MTTALGDIGISRFVLSAAIAWTCFGSAWAGGDSDHTTGASAPPAYPFAAAATESTLASTSSPDTVESTRPDSVAAVLNPAAPRDTSVRDSSATSRPRSQAARAMADTVTVLPRVDVNGGRPEPPRATATTIRLGRAEVARFLPATAADAIGTVPGVNLVKTGPWAAQIFMRGLGGNRVVVMRDGVRLNTARGHGPMSSVIPVDRIQSVELTPGASSTLYGNGALAGVVDFVTHRPLFAEETVTGAMLAARATEPGGSHTQTLWAGIKSPRFGAEVTGGLGSLDGLNTPLGRVPNSGFHDEDMTGRTAAILGPAQLDFEHLHHAARDVGLPAFNTALGATGVYPLQGRDSDRLELTMPGARFRPGFRLLATQHRLRTDFTETTVSERYVRGNLVATNTTVAQDRVTTRMKSLEPQLHFEGPIDVRVIAEYRHEEADGPRDTETTTRDRNGNVTGVATGTGLSMPGATRQGWAAGVLLADTLLGTRIETGVRYDVYRTRADSLGSLERSDARDRRVSPEFGLARRLAGVEPYLHLASGFRVPSLDERYYDDEVHGGLRLFGNPDLVPEESQLYEAGIRLAPDRVGWMPAARVSVYRTEARDLITFHYIDQLYGVPRFQYFNVRRARIEGIEGEIKLRRDALGAKLDLSFPRGTDRETGDRLTDIGTARASLDLTLQLPRFLPQGGVATRLLWNQAVRGSDEVLLRPDYFVVSAEASAVLLGVRAVVAIENLGDVLYREPLSFIDAPGRTFSLSLRREFNLSLASARKER